MYYYISQRALLSNVAAWMGGESGRGWIQAYMTEHLWGPPETTTALLIGYTSM